MRLKKSARIFLCMVLVLATIVTGTVSVSAASLSSSELTSNGAFVMDAQTGEELWGYNADKQLVPASMTKVMAVYVVYRALEEGWITKDTVVPISSSTAAFSRNGTYSNVPLYTDQTYTVDELLDAVIVYSGCAATRALGELIAGSETAFVRMMNAMVSELGLNASYADSYGGSASNKISPRSMAYLAYRMIQDYPDYLNYSSKKSCTIHGVTYNTTNSFIRGAYSTDGAVVDGIKTGTTTAAGKCITVTATKDGHRIITVTMGSKNATARYTDSQKLMKYGFDLIAEFMQNGAYYSLQHVRDVVVNGETKQVLAFPAGNDWYVSMQEAATLLNGTSAQFNFRYDSETGRMTMTTGQGYTDGVPDPVSGMQIALPSTMNVVVDGELCTLSTYTIGGVVYFALSDLSALAGASRSSENITTPETVGGMLDVKLSDWYSSSVEYVINNNIMSGMPDNTFRGDDNLSRAMVVQILYNMEGKPQIEEDEGSADFQDVNSDAWFHDAVYWASSGGIVMGRSETSFDPDANVTREEFLTILKRYEEWLNNDVSATTDLSSFSDSVKIQSYAVSSFGWAVAEGLVHGRDSGILDPGGYATRAEAATMIHNLLENIETAEAEASEEAADAVDTAASDETAAVVDDAEDADVTDAVVTDDAEELRAAA